MSNSRSASMTSISCAAMRARGRPPHSSRMQRWPLAVAQVVHSVRRQRRQRWRHGSHSAPGLVQPTALHWNWRPPDRFLLATHDAHAGRRRRMPPGGATPGQPRAHVGTQPGQTRRPQPSSRSRRRCPRSLVPTMLAPSARVVPHTRTCAAQTAAPHRPEGATARTPSPPPSPSARAAVSLGHVQHATKVVALQPGCAHVGGPPIASAIASRIARETQRSCMRS
mmetsp:Transcript_21160/g.74627  ORF Transcript_21160/g.74627 Transcript_21160/m.74627 type:complete len:224 (+) Transcript_21160:144-815(+)